MNIYYVTMGYSQFRDNIKTVLNQIDENHVPVVVTRANAPDSVILSRGDYDGIVETIYLLSSPENARLLLGAVAETDGSDPTGEADRP